MQLTYNDVALHDLALIENVGQSWAPAPDATAPQRVTVSLRVRLHFFESTFGANRSLVDTARTGLRTTRATLLWKNETTGTTYYSGEACIGPYSWPDDGKGGTRHQILELEFSWHEHDKTGPYVQATFQATGSETEYTLGRVQRMSGGYSAARYSQFHSQRSGAAGRVSLSGQYPATNGLDLAARMTELLALKEQWESAVNGVDGRLAFGSFDRTVRVEQMTAEIGAAAETLDWSIDASYTRWPNESDGVLVEYETETQEDAGTGQVHVSLSGRIMAPTSALARASYAALRSEIISAPPTGTTLASDGARLNEQNVEADTDGDAFLELRFSEMFRATKGGSICEWTLRMSDDEDPKSGKIRRSYSGTVRAKGATFSSAYQEAVTKARSLAANKHAAMISGRVSSTDAQQSADYAGSGTDRYCTIEFEWSYQLAAGADKVWVEIQSEAQFETFGSDRENVSGSVMASTAATARTLYATIKAGYGTYLIESERVSERRVKVATGSAPIGSTRTPPNSSTWGIAVNASEIRDDKPDDAGGSIVNPPLLGEDYTRQWDGLSFTLSVFRPKTASRIAIRYERESATNYLQRVTQSRFSGTVWADTEANAQSAIDRMLPAGVTWTSRSLRTERGKFLGAIASATDDRPATDPESGKPGYLYQAQFSAEYTQRLEGEDALIEVELSDEYQHSGPRLNVKPTAFGRDVVQMCGYSSGTRTIRGSATASTEDMAMAWCRQQWSLSFSSALGTAPATRYRNPPRFTTQPVWVPLQSAPDARGESANVSVWKVGFEYQEILPTFDAAMT